MASTYLERVELVEKFVNDPMTTYGEGLRHLWTWVRYELALRKHDAAATMIDKYSKKLNQDIRVLNFRHEIEETM